MGQDINNPGNTARPGAGMTAPDCSDQGKSDRKVIIELVYVVLKNQ